MKTIETTAIVTDDRKLTLTLPADVSPGPHRVVVMIDEQSSEPPSREPLRFSAYPFGLVSADFTARREDLYGDDGR